MLITSTREEDAGSMEVTEENITPKELMEKIAELDYSQSQLRDLNIEMRRWLDVADDDMVVLRSENTALRKQVKDLEKMASDAEQVEAEPCRLILADEPSEKRCDENYIQKLENTQEYTVIKEENKKLTAKVKSLQQQTEQDKKSLSTLSVAIHSLKCEMEEAQLGLLHREDVINQQNLQLKYAEEIVEECSDFMKDLKLTNQELKRQLEDQQDEDSFTILNDVMGKEERSHIPVPSLAEEIKLLASWSEEEAEAEEVLELQSLTASSRTKRCAGSSETAVQKAGLFMLWILAFIFLAFVASRNSAGDFFSINTLWSVAHLMIQPYCTVHYGALPPI
ncbi:uncharacterized protein LOC122990174 [Scomber scombrus]|uniref:Uncharacterized protein LOC122990174 n=1 Tax=Scomber scombrus TaxID=13677 RepID=A0AAV1PN93_SCOSC